MNNPYRFCRLVSDPAALQVRVCTGCCDSLRKASNRKMPSPARPRRTVRFCEERPSSPYLDWLASNSEDDLSDCVTEELPIDQRRHRMVSISNRKRQCNGASSCSLSSISSTPSWFEIASSFDSSSSELIPLEPSSPTTSGDVCMQIIKACWEETIGRRGIDIESNFFKIGGHSVHAMKVVSELSSKLNTPVSVQHLYDHPTIKELTSKVCSNSEIKDSKNPFDKVIISFDSDYVHDVDANDILSSDSCTTRVKACWEETLGQQDIDVESNFFKIGGHSVHAMKVVSELSIKLRTSLSVQHLYDYPTIKELASQVCSNSKVSDVDYEIEEDTKRPRVAEESGWCDSCYEEYPISKMHITRSGVKCVDCLEDRL